MTSILVETLADSRDGSRVLDATITATATRARANGAELKLPEPVTVRLRKGQLSAPLMLDEPDGTWAWTISVRPTGAPLRRAMTGTYRFSGDEVTWADMELIDPRTLDPLPPSPSVQELLEQASNASILADALLTSQLAQLARNPDLLIAGSIIRNGNDVIVSAGVLWPDGTIGLYTSDSIDVSGAINGYHITYGDPVTRTFTQPTMTRNANGAVTVLPPIVES